MTSLIKARVELSSSGWRVVWAQSVNEMVYNRRKRRRFKKALKTLTLDQMMAVINRMLDDHEQFLERTPQLTGVARSDTLPR
jgi:hypothetical protein